MAAESPNVQPDRVVLLHGLAQPSWRLHPLASRLRAEGYETRLLSYPSTRMRIEEITACLRDTSLDREFWETAHRVHFVTHSMGGLVARRYLDRYKRDIPANKIGRVVMIAPPNKGSEVADRFHRSRLHRWLYGPALSDLTTDARQSGDGKPGFEFGVIAGSKHWLYPFGARMIKRPNDGRVAIDNTKLAGMKDHIVIGGSHTFIVDRPQTHRQVVHFLQKGAFDHDG
jgi:pimeloyl-ACP methyl ester carboxylesterase